MRHGTAAAYKSAGCRCDACRTASTAAMRAYRAGYRSPRGRPPGPRKRALVAARRLVDSLFQRRDGWSEFDIMVDQESVVELDRALREAGL